MHISERWARKRQREIVKELERDGNGSHSEPVVACRTEATAAGSYSGCEPA